eukprot:GHVU01130583.1.p2 GENE.GHVU01130583.1~~GHVU01130583.1.p2  ORF type:complete len:105 (+),score=21.45 GHVU01130583.1:289-603(+)
MNGWMNECRVTVERLMQRRLQTVVFKTRLAKSIHHARVMIRQKHVNVGRQKVDVPSFMVRLDSEKTILHDPRSPLAGGRPGRVKRKSLAKGTGNQDAGDDEEED